MTAAHGYLPAYTVADYRQWAGDWELWDGIAIAMTPSSFGRHQALATKLARMLGNELERVGCNATVINELDWIVSDSTVVRPDLVVVCGDPPDGHLRMPPALVAEVISASTSMRDRTYKRDLYEQQGVGVYLRVDSDANSLEVEQRDGDGIWQCESVADRVNLRLCKVCEIELSQADLFARSQTHAARPVRAE